MLDFSAFNQIAIIHMSLFISDSNFKTTTYLKKLLEIGSDIFDGEPTVVPLPENAPSDIPRIILLNKDNSKRLEVSPIRVNYIRNKKTADDLLTPQKSMDDASNFLLELLDISKVRCNRLSCVINRFGINDSSGGEIATHFCKDTFLKKESWPPNFCELHAHNIINKFSGDLNANCWVRFKNGKINPEGKEIPVIIIEQDINTSAELMKEISFTADDINTFFSDLYDKANRILKDGFFFED